MSISLDELKYTLNREKIIFNNGSPEEKLSSQTIIQNLEKIIEAISGFEKSEDYKRYAKEFEGKE